MAEHPVLKGYNLEVSNFTLYCHAKKTWAKGVSRGGSCFICAMSPSYLFKLIHTKLRT